MFNPTKTWRRWHRKTNVTLKRHAMASAIAATGVPALVRARGHKIDNIPELPLVVSDAANKIEKTKQAVQLLKDLGCEAELTHVKESKKIRAGRGKARNRRYVMRKGPLIVHNLTREEETEGSSIAKSFRNIPGVEICHVDRLNLLKLAPGGVFGRFVIYTQGAMARLAKLFGSYKGGSQVKKGYTLPRAPMTNTDISRIINSNEIQSVLNARKEQKTAFRQRKNPLKNLSVLGRLCPAATALKKQARCAHDKNSKIAKANAKRAAVKKTKKVALHRQSKAYYKALQGAYVKKVEATEEEAAEE